MHTTSGISRVCALLIDDVESRTNQLRSQSSGEESASFRKMHFERKMHLRDSQIEFEIKLIKTTKLKLLQT